MASKKKLRAEIERLRVSRAGYRTALLDAAGQCTCPALGVASPAVQQPWAAHLARVADAAYREGRRRADDAAYRKGYAPVTALIFLDTETCGLGLDDPIWEIALIRRERDGVETRHEFFVQHDLAAAEALPEQFRADHDSRYDPAAAWPLDKLATVLGYLFRDRPHVVGAVPDFDAYRIQRQLGVSGWHYHLVDVENLAVGWLAGRGVGGPMSPPWDSNDLSRKVGVNPDNFERHTAMGDVLWAKAIYDRVMGVTR